MKVFRAIKITLILVFAGIFQACASGPTQSNTGAIVKDFGDDGLEVLFATEFPVASKDEAIAKAALAFRDGELDKAQFYLVRALKFDITDVMVLVKIGNLHAIQGNAVLAARAFNFALQQEPRQAESLEGLGLLYFRSGNDQKAGELLERAIAIDATLWRANNALGVLADRKRQFGAALAYYDAALEIQPLADSVLINRGYSLFLAKKYHNAALDFYAVATRSNNSLAWQNLAMVYAHRGWYADALETYLNAIEPSAAYNEIGQIAMKNGDTESASYYLNEAVRLSPIYFAKAEKNLVDLRRLSAAGSAN